MKKTDTVPTSLITSIRNGFFSFVNMEHEEALNTVSLIKQHRLILYAGSTLKEDEAIPASLDYIFSVQKKAHDELMKRHERLADMAKSAGVRQFVIMKGTSFERCIYGHAMMRDVGDIDMLVHEEDALKIHPLLIKHGYTQKVGQTSISTENSLATTAIGASRSAINRDASSHPVKISPARSEYSPYVKQGSPTIEIHTGLHQIPSRYISQIIEDGNYDEYGLLVDPSQNFVLLVTNTYENSESFYSNAFDHGMILRDYVDLHHFFYRYADAIDWEKTVNLFRSLGLDDALATVLGNYNLIYGTKGFKKIKDHIKEKPSKWKSDILERMGNKKIAKKAAGNAFRQRIKDISSQRPLPVACIEKRDQHDKCLDCEDIFISTRKQADAIDVTWSIPENLLTDKNLFQTIIYPLGAQSPLLTVKVDLSVYDNKLKAYLHVSKRYKCFSTTKRKTDSPLPLESLRKGHRLFITYRMGLKALGLNDPVDNDQFSIATGIYKQEQKNVFWELPSRHDHLFDDVFTNRSYAVNCDGAIFTVIASNINFMISATQTAVISRIKPLFGKIIENGRSLQTQGKPTREYFIQENPNATFRVNIDDETVTDGIRFPEVVQTLLQDATDNLCNHLPETLHIAHAAAVELDRKAILIMGASGSGKTSLAVACVRYGLFIGDESIFIETDTGKLACEDFPFQLKAVNQDILTALDTSKSVKAAGEAHGTVYYFPRRSIPAVQKPETPRSIKVIVFPEYDSSCKLARLRKMAPSLLPDSILRSFAGSESPSLALRKFFHMVSSNKIILLALKYSDANQAARLLKTNLSKEAS